MENLNFRLILGSNSPRRKELLTQMGFTYEVRPSHVNEDFEADIDPKKLPSMLSERKSYSIEITEQELLLTSDTVVIIEDEILNKPADFQEAKEMLMKLSGKTHQVFTAFSLRTTKGITTMTDHVDVHFRPISEQQIEYYIKNHSPYDRAGAYGIQDWLGLIGIERIKGSFYTVMGLPTHLVFPLLREYSLK